MSQDSGGAQHYLVFICYSSSDRWIARQMAHLIEEQGRDYGITTFLADDKIEGGESILATIRRNLQRCAEFVVLLSQYSVTRQWVMNEVGGAWTLEKRMVAIIDKVRSEDIPDILGPQKHFDLDDFELYVEELVRRAQGVDE